MYGNIQTGSNNKCDSIPFAEQEFSAIETNKVTLAINLSLTVMVINEHLKWSRKNICVFKNNNNKLIKIYISYLSYLCGMRHMLCSVSVCLVDGGGLTGLLQRS
jgi:hypothetical protein